MKFTRNTLTLAVAALVLPAVASSAHAATSFIANSFYDQQHPHSRYGYIEWAEMVKELSNGELQPEVYTGTVLLAPRANLQGIQDNVVQVAHHAAIYTPSEMPVANAVQELGFNYDDPLIGILAVTDFSLNNPTQLAEWEELDIVYLAPITRLPMCCFAASQSAILKSCGVSVFVPQARLFLPGSSKPGEHPSMCLPVRCTAASIVVRWTAPLMQLTT